MARTLSLFPYDASIITEEMVRVRYEASARPGAQEALVQADSEAQRDGPDDGQGLSRERSRRSPRPPWCCTGARMRVVPPPCGGSLLAQTIPAAEPAPVRALWPLGAGRAPYPLSATGARLLRRLTP